MLMVFFVYPAKARRWLDCIFLKQYPNMKKHTIELNKLTAVLMQVNSKKEYI